MTFGSSTNLDFGDLLKPGWTMAALFGAVADVLERKYPGTQDVLPSDAAWMSDTLRAAINGALKDGAPRPKPRVIWTKSQRDRVTLHLDFPTSA